MTLYDYLQNHICREYPQCVIKLVQNLKIQIFHLKNICLAAADMRSVTLYFEKYIYGQAITSSQARY